ncbi:hypothetical protein BD769DRAFT_1387998 [Suillus cothurnatus]|nr:hypothetical protein BD769DRAFT_1387998 [Suillus cothurnatus]
MRLMKLLALALCGWIYADFSIYLLSLNLSFAPLVLPQGARASHMLSIVFFALDGVHGFRREFLVHDEMQYTEYRCAPISAFDLTISGRMQLYESDPFVCLRLFSSNLYIYFMFLVIKIVHLNFLKAWSVFVTHVHDTVSLDHRNLNPTCAALFGVDARALVMKAPQVLRKEMDVARVVMIVLHIHQVRHWTQSQTATAIMDVANICILLQISLLEEVYK